MNKLFITALTLLSASTIWASDSPLWMRYPAISPDGKTIAFTFKGDIYTVPVEGGRATALTTNNSYDTQPVWSPDGQQIAFASDRKGNFDVFIVGKEGGVPKQLTFHSAAERPEIFYDANHILYRASIQQDVNDIQFPGSFEQVYKVNTNGGRPEMFSSLVMEHISINPKTNEILYTDNKGYEDKWRKHHQSSIARDIWSFSNNNQNIYNKITDFAGEDRNAVWAPDGQSFYYLSEEDGSFNVYHRTHDGRPEQITFHKKHPVRFLSIAANETLCYGYNGEIYTLAKGGKPQKVDIQIISDQLENDLILRVYGGGATGLAVSPNGKEVAFIVNGDVYVTSIDYTTTKQITNTPQQERDLSFSADGRSLVYSAERNETWGIYMASLTKKEEKYFTYATDIKEEPLVVGDQTSFQPTFSPDGKEVAFLENRTTLRVINLKSKKIRTVFDGKYNYSYADGDQCYRWSPDSKWFLVRYIAIGGWNNTDIALVKADGSGEVTNLTESGYSEGNPKWVLDGKAMVWSSDRAGYRSHGSWGAENDAYIMFFDQEAYDKFRMSKEEAALAEEIEKEKKEEEKKEEKDKETDKDKKKDKKEEKDKKDKDDKEEPKDLVFDLENRKDRVIRLTVNSSRMGDFFLTPKGDKLYYFAAFESGYDLWVHDLKEHSTKIFMKGVGGGEILTDKKQENLFFISGGGLKKVNIQSSKQDAITFRAEFNYRPMQEREYMFNHIWRQVLDKFYDAQLHGVDWKGYKEAYNKYLPYINNNYDFQEMLSEMLGELNGSHTGARYYPASSGAQTATLGAFYDQNYDGDGLKIEEIIEQGPLSKAKSKVKAGCIIEKIDGKEIKKEENYYPLLAGKAGKNVLVTVYDPTTKERFEQQIKPVSYGEQSELLYKRWIKRNAKLVEELSGGKIGYIHVRAMNSESFRAVYSELLGKYRLCDAVIIDTRHNGGGWLHDDLATLLNGKEYQRFVPRGQYIGSDPFNKWLKPSCVLICEDNYSNAHGFPWVYKTLGIGKLIGAPVPGTMTAVWWERLIDSSMVFGIPQVGVQDMQGNYLENRQLEPDITIYNTPNDQLNGNDAQLKRAVEEMLKETKQ